MCDQPLSRQQLQPSVEVVRRQREDQDRQSDPQQVTTGSEGHEARGHRDEIGPALLRALRAAGVWCRVAGHHQRDAGRGPGPGQLVDLVDVQAGPAKPAHAQPRQQPEDTGDNCPTTPPRNALPRPWSAWRRPRGEAHRRATPT